MLCNVTRSNTFFHTKTDHSAASVFIPICAGRRTGMVIYMKIATYNVWNENKGVGNRFDQLVNEINSVGSDIIGLQEVTSYFYETYLASNKNYPFHIYGKYSNEDEGLAILSKYPILESCFLHTSKEHSFSKALNILLEVDGRKISFTNLHLPWNSALEKERQICEIDRYLHTQLSQNGLLIMVGDFNGGMNSSIHRYLIGEQSLNGCESNPYWDELATGYSAISGEPIRATLDTITNPRWAGSKAAYPPTATDRIYTLEYRYDFSLESLRIFGTTISPQNGLAPSDHYGVVAEIEFDE